MFFQKFSPLTSDEVNRKTAALPRARDGAYSPGKDRLFFSDGNKAARFAEDGFASDACALLADRQLKLQLSGPYAPAQLDYSFGGGTGGTLTVAENGTEYTNVPYNAIRLRRGVVLFTHMIPGTSRGWHIVADLDTSLVTAFETWFGVTVPVGGNLSRTRQPESFRDIPREVQRQYHFGYDEIGRRAHFGAHGPETPDKLHGTTNRIEGRGLHWAYDDGSECLTFFPSVVCSITVPLGEASDTLALSYPSDFLRIDDDIYIFAKWGVEYGGEMWLEVVDMRELRAVGVKFGFDAADEFEYSLHSALLTVTGDAAHLEKITDYGEDAPPMIMLKDGKGARYAYRPRDMDIPMTGAEAAEAAKHKRVYDFSVPNSMSGNCLPLNYSLAGRRLVLEYDHVETPYAWSAKNTPDKLPTSYEYEFTSANTLRWRAKADGVGDTGSTGGAAAIRDEWGDWREEKYICFEPARDIYFFSHLLTGEPDSASAVQAVDFSTGLATCVYARIGSWTSEWEAGATCLFGTAAGEGVAPAPFGRRHGFTNDLVGKCYAWSYSEQANSIHIYSSPKSYSWTIFQADNSGGASWSSPGFYVKLREDAYLFQWVEENCNGAQSVVCFNPRVMHDSGFSYGVTSHGGLQLSIMGAFARRLGSFDIMKYFDKSTLR